MKYSPSVLKPTRTVWGTTVLVATLGIASAACAGDADQSAAESAEAGEPGEAEPDAETSEPETLTEITLQLGWLVDNKVLGEVTAQTLGFYEEEGLEVTIEPGGPSVDGVALVASGQADIGQLASSPSAMLARSEGVPIKVFAVGSQQHPFAWVSLPDTALDGVDDLTGTKVGAPATSEILLNASMAANGMTMEAIDEFVPTGGDWATTLLTGQIDVAGTWTTSPSLAAIPGGYDDLLLRDTGVDLYAMPYYARDEFLDESPDVVDGFVRATARGWLHALENPDEAIGFILDAYPNLVENDGDDEAFHEGANRMLEFVGSDSTQSDGWGTMTTDNWEAQIDMWDDLSQFSAEPPTVEEFVTFDVLERTSDARRPS